MFCRYCGKEVGNNAKFCNHCGKQLNTDGRGTETLEQMPQAPIKVVAQQMPQTPPQKEMQPKARRSKMPLVVVVLLLICIPVLVVGGIFAVKIIDNSVTAWQEAQRDAEEEEREERRKAKRAEKEKEAGARSEAVGEATESEQRIIGGETAEADKQTAGGETAEAVEQTDAGEGSNQQAVAEQQGNDLSTDVSLSGDFSEDNVGEMTQYILPESNSRFLTKDDLAGFTKEQCRIARNELFARHGRIFQDEELRAYFEGCDWYEGTVLPEEFDEAIFNAYEIANRDLIVEYEKEQGYR